MKITPIEIKQKTFASKSFGKGYDKEEVQNFLSLLSQEWEKKSDENKEMKIKIELLEKEITKLKEVESSLFRTLKTAEDTSANMVDQARKTGELKIREAQIKADVILNDAREQAKTIVQKSQIRSRDTIQDMVREVKSIEREYRDLEMFKNNFISEMQVFLKEKLEKLQRYERSEPNPVFEDKVQKAYDYLEERDEYIDQQEVIIKQDQDKKEPELPVNQTPLSDEPLTQIEPDTGENANPPKDQNSFFEDLNS